MEMAFERLHHHTKICTRYVLDTAVFLSWFDYLFLVDLCYIFIYSLQDYSNGIIFRCSGASEGILKGAGNIYRY